jgi:hypothetical protein
MPGHELEFSIVTGQRSFKTSMQEAGGLDHDHADSTAIRVSVGQPEKRHEPSVAGRRPRQSTVDCPKRLFWGLKGKHHSPGNSARSAVRPSSVRVRRPRPSRTIRPRTTNAVMVSPVTPARCQSVPLPKPAPADVDLAALHRE